MCTASAPKDERFRTREQSMSIITSSSPQTPVVIREAGHTESPELWLLMPLFDPALARRDSKQPEEEPQAQAA